MFDPVTGLQGTTSNMPMNLRQVLTHGARSHRDQEVITDTPDGSTGLTYYELHERAKQAANMLQELGVEPGDVVGLYGYSTHSYMELLFASAGIGAVPFTINIDLPPEHQQFCVDHVGDNAPFEYVFVDAELYDQFQSNLGDHEFEVVMLDNGTGDGIPAELPWYDDLLAQQSSAFEWPFIDEDSAALLMFTSGTTGKPKAMAHSHRGLYLSALHMAAAYDIGPQDSILMIPPMFHLGWLLWAFAPAVGAKLVLPGVNYPDNLVDLFIAEDVTFAAGVPTLFQRVLARIDELEDEGEHVDLEDVHIKLAGQLPPISLLRELEELGATTSQIYSFTESVGPPMSTNIQVDLREKEATMSKDELLRWKSEVPGYFMVGVDAKLFDPADGSEVAMDGESAGEFAFRAPWGTAGYWNMPERTEEALTDDGYLKMGDLVSVDEYGDIEFRDRLKDAVKSGGEWIPSPILEDAIAEHPDIDQVCVIAAEHEEWIERPVAIITLVDGATPDDIDLDAFLAPYVEDGEIERWWLPDDVVILDEIPISSTGKYDKATLRDEFADVLTS